MASFNEPAIMQAGDWKQANAVLRYVQHATIKEPHAQPWWFLDNSR